ncbi:MAG TPA: hypothetical protein VFN90_04195 [Gemmatimonadales bacterium]|nr:hypothetical protein [Gemmatimonadales bacterium]
MALLLGAVPAAAQDSVAVPLGPRYGTGRVWVRPLRETPAEMVQRLTGRSIKEMVDSALTAVVQADLDRRARALEEARRATDWTTTIGGQKVGLDQRWIHVGPLKVPTALLALIPLNIQANPQQVEQARKMQLMQDVIRVAGDRGTSLDEITRSARALRAEKERQRELQRNQRMPPPPLPPDTAEARP